MTLTFVLDTSGSMSGPAIERERAAVAAIAQSLAKGDIVNMVTWNTSNNVVMQGRKVLGPNDPEVLAVANSIAASGGASLTGIEISSRSNRRHPSPWRYSSESSGCSSRTNRSS